MHHPDWPGLMPEPAVFLLGSNASVTSTGVKHAKMNQLTELERPKPSTQLTNESSAAPHCRFCEEPLRHTFVDLGMSPLCETYLTPGQLNRMEPFYPLHVKVCEKCYLVQLEEVRQPGEHIY